MKKLKQVLISAGILLFLLLIYTFNWKEVIGNLQQIGYWIIPILPIGLSWFFMHSLGWKFILKALGEDVPVSILFKIKLIGESINMLVPSANIGGETARAVALKPYIHISKGAPSVLIDKTIDFLTKVIYISFGLLLAVIWLDIPKSMLFTCIVIIFTLLFLGGFVMFLQIKGFFNTILKVSRFIPLLHKYIIKNRDKLEKFDDSLKTVYTHGLTNIATAAFCHFSCKLLGVVEIMAILFVLKTNVTFIDSLFISSLSRMSQSIFFMLPGQWGVAEGTQIFAATTLGFSASIGLSLGIIRRFRRLLYSGVGLLMTFTLEKTKKNVPMAVQENQHSF